MQDLTLRSTTPADLQTLAAICFDAFGGINARHGFPSDFPAPEVAEGMMGFVLNAPTVVGFVAEQNGKVVGSNFLWKSGATAGVGPITVDPAAQGGVGRRLMQAALDHADELNIPAVRLVQAAFNTTSLSLYTKFGFDVREPLVCMQGKPINEPVAGYSVRPATAADVSACADVCRRVHGHDRTGELQGAIANGPSAIVAERGGEVVGYASDVGFLGHTVALDNAGLMALIAGAKQYSGPGFLLPSRNGEVFRWCLSKGLKVIQPLTLMSRGLYNEPRGAFVPSILY